MTPTQKKYFAAIQEHGGIRAAARALGVHHSTVQKSIKAARMRRDAEMGLPVGQTLKGVSTLEDQDGEMTGRWVKTTREGQTPEDTDQLPDPKTIVKQSRLFDADGNVTQAWYTERPDLILQAKKWEAFADELAQKITPVEPKAAPVMTHDTLANVYTFTDCHVGMLAWHEEGGHDWDTKIAEETLTRTLDTMISNAPSAHTAYIAQIGDFLHYDSLMAVTPTSGHVLDADTRFEKLVRAAARILRRLVDRALESHREVVVLLAEGNHDMASSVWLRTTFGMLYENEPRVKVIQSAKPYYAEQWGETMLFWHHTHLSKLHNLPAVAAAEFPKIWGATKYRYAHGGDKHHRESKEYAGMIVEQHPTLAARDAYASRHGWKSIRSANAITYHKDFGEVGRVLVTPEMVG